MKKFNQLYVIILCLAFSLQMNGQTRYLDQIFDEVEITTDHEYGINATVLTFQLLGEAVEESLLFDFYQPVGDDICMQRPLVILLHTGNFLPQNLNGSVYGTRTDSSNVEIATRLAKMGYVVANIDYRLGWDPLAPTQPLRALQLIQAAYRGVQDVRTAIRFFKRDFVENNNSFGVDTSRITVWGIGTGGYVSLGAAYLNEFADIANTTNPPFKFLLDVDGDDNPDVTMINEFEFGDIYGTSDGVSLGNNGVIGMPLDDVTCIPNHVGYSSKFLLCVNMAGANGDISWLKPGEVPLIAYHVPTDPFAPYIDDVLVVPTTGDRIVQVQGSQALVERANELGLNQAFIDANIDDEFTAAARASSAKAGHEYIEGLCPFIRPTNPLGNEEGDPWQWWDAEFWGGIVADTATGANWDQVSRLNNFDASAEKAKLYIDTIIGYFAPRAFAALSLTDSMKYDTCFTLPTSINDFLSDLEVGLQLAPNPTLDYTYIQTNSEFPIRTINLYNLQGALVQSMDNINDNQVTLKRQGLPKGIYIAKMRFDEGIISKKIIFN